MKFLTANSCPPFRANIFVILIRFAHPLECPLVRAETVYHYYNSTV